MATYTSICEFRAVQLDNMHSNEATLIKAYNTVCGFYFHIKNQKSCIAMSSPPAKIITQLINALNTLIEHSLP